MIKRFSTLSKFPRLASAGLGALVFALAGATVAQNAAVPGNLEQTAPALPAEDPARGHASLEQATAAKPASASVEQTATRTEPVIEDYSEKIGTGLKERERRLTLLNEAMMKLREAGEMEDATRVEDRIRALLAMPAPSQANAQLKGELEQLRAKNDELVVQLVAMEEELKRLRGTGSGSIISRRR